MDHVNLETTCSEGLITKNICVNYLIVDALFLYNIILGRSIINALEEIVCTLYPTLKYSLLDRRDNTIRGDQ